jgi:hypothetical protein
MKTELEFARERLERIEQIYLNQLALGTWNNSIYWIMQVIMILFAILFVGLALFIPSNPLSYTENINSRTSIHGTVHNDDITIIMLVIKVTAFVAGLGFICAAVLCSKVRKRSNLLFQLKTELKKVVTG